LVIQVGHIERFNPAYIELKNVLEDLTPLAINFRRLSPFKGSNTDVDVVLDLMTHDLDLVLDLLQQTPNCVNAVGLNVFSSMLDHAVVQLGFLSGPLVTITASRVTEQKIRAIDVTARDAYLEVDLLNKTIAVHRRSVGQYLHQNHDHVKYHQESLVERILVPNIEPLLFEIQHFIQCITSDQQPSVCVRNGWDALKLACEIREQITSRQGFVNNIPVPA
jgi:virulence factor